MAHEAVTCTQWWLFSINAKEIVMNYIRRVRRLIHPLAALGCALFALGAVSPAAFAGTITLPAPTGGGAATGTQPAPVHTVIVGGTPGWQITLIAVGAAVLAALVAVSLDRVRATRRRALPHAA